MTARTSFANLYPSGEISPVADLWIGSTVLDQASVRSVTIQRTENQHDLATIEFRSLPSQGLSFQRASPVHMRWGIGPNLYKNYYGYVSSIDPTHQAYGVNDVSQGSISVLGVTAAMNKVAPETWQHRNIPSIVQEVAERYRMSVVTDSHDHIWPLLIRTGETDWEWLVKLANMIGYRLVSDGTHLRLYNPGRVAELASTVPQLRTVETGNANINSFTASISNTTDSAREWFGFSSEGIKYDTAQTDMIPLLGQVASDRPRAGMAAGPTADYATTQAYADATKLRNFWSLTASVDGVGNPDVQPGGLVQILGPSNEYTGYWCVTDAKHTVTVGYMKLEASLGKDAVLDRPVRRRRTSQQPPTKLLPSGQWAAAWATPNLDQPAVREFYMQPTFAVPQASSDVVVGTVTFPDTSGTSAALVLTPGEGSFALTGSLPFFGTSAALVLTPGSGSGAPVTHDVNIIGSSVGGLTWPPPTGYEGFTVYTINADGTGASSSTINGVTTHTLNDGIDYTISAPVTITNAISIKGGRNVVWIGGHVRIDNKGSFPIGDVRRALLIQDGAGAVTGRIVHLEGILLDGDDLADALNLDCPAAIVQMQNYRGDGCHFRSCDDRDSTQDYTGIGTHPDVIQPWGGCYEWRSDKVTGVSAYQGFFLNSILLSEAPAKTYIRRYNWRAVGHTSNEEGPFAVGGSYTVGQTLATFDATTEAWSSGNSGSTITQTATSPQSGAGALSIARTFATTFDQVWVRSPIGQTITETRLGAWVKAPAGALGSWTARVGFNLAAGTTVVPTAATSIAADGAWHFVSCDITALGHVPADVDRVLVQVQRASGQALTTLNIGVDTVTSGSIPSSGFTGPTETYFGIRALSLGTNWNDVYTDTNAGAGIYIEHSVNSGWTTPGNTGPSRKGTSGFYNTRFYDNTHALADANGYVLDPPPGTSQFNNALFPTPSALATDAFVDWTGDARLHNWDGTGNARVYRGAPPNGDYVPASSVGTSYSSPGYGTSGSLVLAGNSGTFSRTGARVLVGTSAALTLLTGSGTFSVVVIPTSANAVGTSATLTLARGSGAFSATGTPTWAGTSAAVTLAGTPGTFTATGTRAWIGTSANAITVVGGPGTFTATGTRTWAGTSGALVFTTASGTLSTGGTLTWAGTAAAAHVITGGSGSFSAGGTVLWAGTSATTTFTVVGASGSFTATGTRTWAGTSIALVFTHASGTFSVGGTLTWTGTSAVAIVVLGTSGTFALSGTRAWTGASSAALVVTPGSGALSVSIVDAYTDDYRDLYGGAPSVNIPGASAVHVLTPGSGTFSVGGALTDYYSNTYDASYGTAPMVNITGTSAARVLTPGSGTFVLSGTHVWVGTSGARVLTATSGTFSVVAAPAATYPTTYKTTY